MLKLTKCLGEEIIVGGNITLRVTQIRRPHVVITCVGPDLDEVGAWWRIPKRKKVERKVVVFGDDIEVDVEEVNARIVRLGISSRSDKSIYRRELLERGQ